MSKNFPDESEPKPGRTAGGNFRKTHSGNHYGWQSVISVKEQIRTDAGRGLFKTGGRSGLVTTVRRKFMFRKETTQEELQDTVYQLEDPTVQINEKVCCVQSFRKRMWTESETEVLRQLLKEHYGNLQGIWH